MSAEAENLAALVETLDRVTSERDAFRDERNDAQAAVERVRELHRPCAQREDCGQNDDSFCCACELHVPCPTILTLDGER